MYTYIVRIDTGATHGWQVRFADRGDRKRYTSRLFSDRVCGGPEKARSAAVTFQQSMAGLRGYDLTPPPQLSGPIAHRLATNTSGKTGVHRSRFVRGSRIYPYWCATFSIGPNGGKIAGTKYFYFGGSRSEPEAKRLAVEFRTAYEHAFRDRGVEGVVEFFHRREEETIESDR